MTIPPLAASLIVDLVKFAIHQVRGDSTDDAAKNVASAIADKVLEGVGALIAVELKKYEAALGMVLATRDLADAVQALVLGIREAERGAKSIPALLDITEMPADWKPEPETP